MSVRIPDIVLVTGAGGYLGGATASALAADGYRAIAVHRRPLAGPSPANIVPAACALDDREEVGRLLDLHRPRTIVHTAAWIPRTGIYSVTDLARAADDNIRATLNLITAAVAAGVQRFILCSSIEVYSTTPCNGMAHREGDPLLPQTAYGRSKLAAEMAVGLLEGTATQPVILRLPGIHGLPRQAGLVFNVIRNALAGTPIAISEPDSRLSLLMLDDAVALLRALAVNPMPSGAITLNLASGTLSLRELARMVVEKTGSTSTVEATDGPARNRALDAALARTLDYLPEPSLAASLQREIARHRAQAE